MGLTDKALVAPTESEAQRIEATYKAYGEGIVIIDGDDDWGADPIFRVRGALKKAGFMKKVPSLFAGMVPVSSTSKIKKPMGLR